MTEWRTIVTSSGALSHAFAGATSACGRYVRTDTRARASGERYCQRCKHIVERRDEKAAAKKAQEPLPFGPVSGANAAIAAAWKAGVR